MSTTQIIQVVIAFFGSIFPAVLFNIDRRKIGWAGLSGALGWFVYLVIFQQGIDIGRPEGVQLLRGMAAAGVPLIGGTVKLGMPALANPDLPGIHQAGHVFILKTGKVPDKPANAVTIRLGPVV